MRGGLVLGGPRELGTVGLVAALSGCYAGVLVTTSSFLAAGGEHAAAMGAILQVVSTVFILIAVYVAAVVIVNAVDTVLAGRLPQIALLRLLGARAATLRATVMRGVGVVGAASAVLGAVVGTARSRPAPCGAGARRTPPAPALPGDQRVAGRPGAHRGGRLRRWPDGWARAASSGCRPRRRCPAPSPPTRSHAGSRRTRAAVSLVLIAGGALLLVAAAAARRDGARSPASSSPFLGAMTASTGLLVGARTVIPGLVALTSRLLGRSPEARIAGRNALKDPLRTTRSTMGLVIGVTLVTTFASGLTALRRSVSSWPDMSAAQQAQAHRAISTTTQVLVAVVVITSLISAVGFVSTMSLTVIQRRREIGLLRALGFTRRQVRRMITLESAALSATAIAFGMALGLVFGSVGAQSLVGSYTRGSSGACRGSSWPARSSAARAGRGRGPPTGPPRGPGDAGRGAAGDLRRGAGSVLRTVPLRLLPAP